jgi:recombination protein RecA
MSGKEEQKTGEPRGGEKDQTLDSALAQIEKSYGKGAIMRLGDAPATRNIEVIPTGALTLDLALGVGGVPRGRVIEIYGPESSGKTTLALHIVAQAQKLGGVAAFIDAEHALDPLYAGRIGVNTDDLLVSQPDTGEQALEIVDVLVRSQAVDIVVIDSVAALVPKAEIDGEMGDSHVGLQARLMSQALRKLTGAISKSSTSVVFINQLREKIGVMFGNPEVTTGGRALKFYASVRLDVRKIDTIKSGLDVIGSRVKVKVVKNKVAPPFKSAEFDILYNEGISYLGSVLDAGIDAGVIDKQGAWFSYGDDRLGQGRENVREHLRANGDLADKIVGELKAKVVPPAPPAPMAPAPLPPAAPAEAAKTAGADGHVPVASENDAPKSPEPVPAEAAKAAPARKESVAGR